MKKNYVLFFCFMSALFLLAACQSAEQKNDKTVVKTTDEKTGEKASMQERSNSGNGITFTTEKEKYTASDKEIIVNIQNENDTYFTYGQQFSIEKNIDGTWYVLPFKEGMKLFQEKAYTLQAKGSATQTISLDRLKNKPSLGKYRIIKIFNNPEDYFLEENIEKKPINSPTLAAPFEVVSKEKTITVEKRVGNEDKHGYFREITDAKQISKAINVLEKANWENAEVNMAYPPHYKFCFEHMEKETELDSVVYALWISPKKDKIELVMQGKGKYIQLNKSKSAELFEIITGEKLSDLK
ncbi:immunoglobulin-like domain-containing protein [Pseudobacillus badius]|uniref:immunoglobulin-like domain-containing protein n=1 Tax=Bacillus badius TaxID=1455 RepID=UPI003D32E3DC